MKHAHYHPICCTGRGEAADVAVLCGCVCMLCQPTTGLDSVRAEDVVSSLHALATSKGIVILSSIHMPSGKTQPAQTHHTGTLKTRCVLTRSLSHVWVWMCAQARPWACSAT